MIAAQYSRAFRKVLCNNSKRAKYDACAVTATVYFICWHSKSPYGRSNAFSIAAGASPITKTKLVTCGQMVWGLT